VSEGDPSAARLREYQERWEEEFARMFKLAGKASRVLSGMSNEELNALAEALDQEDILRLVRGEGVAKVARKVVKRKPSLLKYARHLLR